MANNRLYIRCKQCGEKILIGKHLAAELHIPENLERNLQEFYSDHMYCEYCHYDLELCEEFPCEMTDNPIDDCGRDCSCEIACDNVMIFNWDKCKDIDYDSFPSEARIYTAPDAWCGGMYCISINALTWIRDGLSWEEYKNMHAGIILEVR